MSMFDDFEALFNDLSSLGDPSSFHKKTDDPFELNRMYCRSIERSCRILRERDAAKKGAGQ